MERWKPPTNLEEAKAALAGEVGVELNKYPLRFATQVFFGPPPQHGQEVSVNSGSASLVQLGTRHFAVTCAHVIAGYRQRLEQEPDCIFQLGNCRLNPLGQLALDDQHLDASAIALTPEQAHEITHHEGEFGRHFVVPPHWPPEPVSERDFVAFGGFPGELRKVQSFDELSFGTFGSAAARVTAAREDYIVCQFDEENWVRCGFEQSPVSIGGMSGGPVFALRTSAETQITTYEFIGHIYEFSEDFKLLYIRLARALPIPPA